MKGNCSTIETKYDKYVKNVAVHETVKEVYEGTVTKENFTQFTRDHITSLESENVENIFEINNYLVIEAELTKTIKQLYN